MPANDMVRLRHILEAAREAGAFLQGKSSEDLHADRMLNLSIVRLLEIIGEAARGVSPACRTAHPEIAWQEMAGMRDRLAHGYFDVDLNVVWQTVTQDLPALLGQLDKILPPENE